MKACISLVILALLVTPSLQKTYSIKVSELFLHPSASFDEAFSDGSVAKKQCGESIEISSYNPPYLYISVSGKSLDNKKAIV